MQTARSPDDMASPSRRTRQQEKEELQHLNDRFLTYIEHVKRLRNEKQRVDSAYEHLQSTTFEESSSIRRGYDRELEDARLLIDETAKEKARYQILSSKNAEKVTALEAELKELNEEFTRVQHELEDAKLSIEDSERQRRAANAERISTQHKLQEMDEEVDELRSQIKKLQETLEQETLAKVDLQNQMQSLKEDMAFRKKMYEEEIYKKRTEVISDKSNVGVEENDYDFTDRLQQAIDEAREEIERETEQYRQDLEKAYRAKLDMLEKQTTRDSTTITRQHSEIHQLNATLSQSSRSMSSLQEEKDRLEVLVRDKTEQLAVIKERHSDEVSHLMQEMRTLRVNYEEKIKEYEDLLDLRIKLEQEIATLSALLQEEENRLNISSTPTRDKRRRPVDKDGPRSKRSKKQVDSTSSSSAGSIQICDVDVDGRYVQIKNMSDKMEPLGGFKIVYEVEDTGEKAEFKFHNKSKLQGGACVTVWAAGADDAVHNPPTDIIWKSTQNWGQGTKTLTYLCSKNGEVVAKFAQRKELSITETPTSSQTIELDQTDAGARGFPYIPDESPIRVRQTEHIFHQQDDPVNADRPPKQDCVIC